MARVLRASFSGGVAVISNCDGSSSRHDLGRPEGRQSFAVVVKSLGLNFLDDISDLIGRQYR